MRYAPHKLLVFDENRLVLKKHTTTMEVKFYDLEAMHAPLKQQVLTAWERIYDTGGFIMGPHLEDFEKQYAAFCGSNYCIGVGNGYDALVLALRALNIGTGDEVIVPANTYIATWLAVTAVGATPVPVEPGLDTANLNPALLQTAITSNTKAIIPVHLYGQPCEMDQIMEVAHRYKLFVIEDNAQAQGATFKGKRTGSWGHLAATSFYPGKNLGAMGDGGATTTKDAQLAERLYALRNFGSAQKYYNREAGVNSRLDELQAAALSIKLSYLQQWNKERQEIAAYYREHLSHCGDIKLPKLAEGADSVYHQFEIYTRQRDALQQHLQGKGIGTHLHYPVPPHLQQAYEHLGYKKGDFPITEQMASTCLSLPIYPGLTEKQLSYVVQQVKGYYGSRSAI